MRKAVFLLPALLACLWPAAAMAQEPTPSPNPAPAPTPAPNIDLRMLRLKLSAGDLPSAESILETHEGELGQDEDFTLGVAWLARGAAMLGDWNAARAWSKRARQIAEAKLQSPEDYEKEREAVYALGTAIEVDAQALAAAGRRTDAIASLAEASRTQERAGAPYNLRARIWKRRNLLELPGEPAPAIPAEDHVGAEPPRLGSLRGKPVVLFFWWESCGDCRAQAPTLRRVIEKYRDRGVAFLAPTRYYGKAEARAEEKGKIEKIWAETYKLAGEVPVPISDAAMVRYGVSATPTFVFVDRRGIVRSYSPTRLSEERLSAEIDRLLAPPARKKS